jgi:hypothetical protein
LRLCPRRLPIDGGSADADEFAVKVYGRDTGVVAIPIFVKGQRDGSATAV